MLGALDTCSHNMVWSVVLHPKHDVQCTHGNVLSLFTLEEPIMHANASPSCSSRKSFGILLE